MRRFVLAALLSGVAVQSGCFGSFALTQKLYQFNDGVSSSIVVKEVVFLVMIIVPVYEIGIFADAIVLNIIEMLTGSNPLAKATLGTDADGAVVHIERTRKGIDVVSMRDGVESRRRFERNEDGWEVLDDTGTRIAWLEEDPNGDVRVMTADGEPLAQYSREHVDQLVASTFTGGWSSMVASLRASSPSVIAAQ